MPFAEGIERLPQRRGGLRLGFFLFRQLPTGVDHLLFISSNELEALNKKFAELTDEELQQVAGSAGLVNDIGPGDPRRQKLASKVNEIDYLIDRSDTTDINSKDLALEECFEIREMLYGEVCFEGYTLRDVFNRISTGKLKSYIYWIRVTETNGNAAAALALLSELYSEIKALL